VAKYVPICACTLWSGGWVSLAKSSTSGKAFGEGCLRPLRMVVGMWLSLMFKFAGFWRGWWHLSFPVGLEEGKEY